MCRRRQPDTRAALRALLSLAASVEPRDGRRIAYVVDGLDEAAPGSSSDEGEVSIPVLLAECARDAPPWLVFLATTRSSLGALEPGADADDALVLTPHLRIELDGRESVTDVANYVRARLARDAGVERGRLRQPRQTTTQSASRATL